MAHYNLETAPTLAPPTALDEVGQLATINERQLANETATIREAPLGSALLATSNGHLLLLFALLVLINLTVILGNILVILAVYFTAKLKSVTNIFIVSLATADLMLGVFVLPYALIFEIFDVWMFGEIWCRGWLVTDVWISTASILNLCAISVDRYVAVTRPVKYRSIMTSRRAKTIVAFVWIVSFLICFPPLLPKWNPHHSASPSQTTSSSALLNLPAASVGNVGAPPPQPVSRFRRRALPTTAGRQAGPNTRGDDDDERNRRSSARPLLWSRGGDDDEAGRIGAIVFGIKSAPTNDAGRSPAAAASDNNNIIGGDTSAPAARLAAAGRPTRGARLRPRRRCRCSASISHDEDDDDGRAASRQPKTSATAREISAPPERRDAEESSSLSSGSHIVSAGEAAAASGSGARGELATSRPPPTRVGAARPKVSLKSVMSELGPPAPPAAAVARRDSEPSRSRASRRGGSQPSSSPLPASLRLPIEQPAAREPSRGADDRRRLAAAPAPQPAKIARQGANIFKTIELLSSSSSLTGCPRRRRARAKERAPDEEARSLSSQLLQQQQQQRRRRQQSRRRAMSSRRLARPFIFLAAREDSEDASMASSDSRASGRQLSGDRLESDQFESDQIEGEQFAAAASLDASRAELCGPNCRASPGGRAGVITAGDKRRPLSEAAVAGAAVAPANGIDYAPSERLAGYSRAADDQCDCDHEADAEAEADDAKCSSNNNNGRRHANDGLAYGCISGRSAPRATGQRGGGEAAETGRETGRAPRDTRADKRRRLSARRGPARGQKRQLGRPGLKRTRRQTRSPEETKAGLSWLGPEVDRSSAAEAGAGAAAGEQWGQFHQLAGDANDDDDDDDDGEEETASRAAPSGRKGVEMFVTESRPRIVGRAASATPEGAAAAVINGTRAPKRSAGKTGCALFDDKPYVIYSALGSFYIPMLIMIFFYSRIYLVASRAQKALRRGYMTTKWAPPRHLRQAGAGQAVASAVSASGASSSLAAPTTRRTSSVSSSCEPTTSQLNSGGQLERTSLGGCAPQRQSQDGGRRQVTLRIHRRNEKPAAAAANLASSSSADAAANKPSDLAAAANANTNANANEDDCRRRAPTQAATLAEAAPACQRDHPAGSGGADRPTDHNQPGDDHGRPSQPREELAEAAARPEAAERDAPGGGGGASEKRRKPSNRLHRHHHHHHRRHHRHRGCAGSRRRHHLAHELIDRPDGEPSSCGGGGAIDRLLRRGGHADNCYKCRCATGSRRRSSAAAAAAESSRAAATVAPPGERGAEPPNRAARENSIASSVQITISQFDDEEAPFSERLVADADLGKAERSKSVDACFGQGSRVDAQDMRAAAGGRRAGEESSQPVEERLAPARADRSQSCGPTTTPTIVVNWIAESGDHRSELLQSASDFGPTKISDSPSGPRAAANRSRSDQQQQQQHHHASLMSSLPQAANQMRKQSMMLLSSLTSRSSQTLRRLSMVASHPVDSLLANLGSSSRSRDDDLSRASSTCSLSSTSGPSTLGSSAASTADNWRSDGAEPARIQRRHRKESKREQARRHKRRHQQRHRYRQRQRSAHKRSSEGGGAPRKTLDDYLMAVAGIDSSSDDSNDEPLGLDLSDYDYDDDDDCFNSEDSGEAKYSLFLARPSSPPPSDCDGGGEALLVGNLRDQSRRQQASGVDANGTQLGPRAMLDAADSDGCENLQISQSTNSAAECLRLAADSPGSRSSSATEQRHLAAAAAAASQTSRPPSALHRQGAYYERATSRDGHQPTSGGEQHSASNTAALLAVMAPNGTGAGDNEQRGSLTTVSKVIRNSFNVGMKAPENSLRISFGGGGRAAARRRGAAKRTSRWHAKRLRAETKAAKTVAIIIGGFIFCWLPFFTAYLSRAIICERPDCIPQSLLSLFIWLGYLNSAINPVIYGLFSADFRHAFKNIVCRCRFRRTDEPATVSILVDSIINSIL